MIERQFNEFMIGREFKASLNFLFNQNSKQWLNCKISSIQVNYKSRFPVGEQSLRSESTRLEDRIKKYPLSKCRSPGARFDRLSEEEEQE